MKYVDLSDTTWDRRSIDYLVQALTATAIQPRPTESTEDQPELSSPDPSDDVDEETPHDCYGSFVPPAPLLKDAEELRAAGLQTLRMDGCGLRASLLEPLCRLKLIFFARREPRS